METRELLAEIYQAMDIEAALPELNPKDKGGYYVLDCPECGDKGRGQAYVYKDNRGYIRCNRLNKCGKTLSLWDYVQRRERLDQGVTFKRLAELAGYALPSLSPETQERMRAAQARAGLLETVLDYFKAQLWATQGRAVLDYLKGRGYTEREIERMELGLFPAPAELAHLVNSVNTVYRVNPADLGLSAAGLGDTHKLAIPYRDPAGRLKGFAVRSIDPQVKPQDKFRYTAGLERDTLFNLHRARGLDALILVEAFLDALIATERGLPGVVAVGGANLTQAQLENVPRSVRQFVLALDSDAAGQDGTERTLDLLDRQGLPGFVVALPAGYKDPDELIRDQAQGIEAFKRLVAQAESAGKWRARRLLSKQDLSTARGRRAAMDAAVAVAERLSPPDAQDFLEPVREAIGLGAELFGEYLKGYRQQKAQERLKGDYENLLREGGRLLADGKLEDVGRLLEEQGRDLRAKTTALAPSPYRLDNLLTEIAQTPEGLKTGYDSLDKLLAIPQAAITIVASRPSHGKTTALLNLLLNMSRLYQDKTFVFFSYEEQRRQIGLKLLDILAGRVILSGKVKDPGLSVRELEGYLRAGRTDRPAVEWGKGELQKLLDSERVLLIDEPYQVGEWADCLTALSRRLSVGAVFVDYIQKVKIPGKWSSRQVELQRVSERILETAKSLSLPVILGAQLGRDKTVKAEERKVRLDNLRESGDIEQDANLVLGLFNESMQKAQDAEQDEEGQPKLLPAVVPLKVSVLKNRNGAVGEERVLNFNRPLLTLSEPEGEW